jgi:hypothetical protein
MLAISQPLLVAQSVDETAVATPEVFKYSGCQRTTHYVSWGTGVTAGVVEIETADDPSYTGTWAPIATVTYASGAPRQSYVYVEGSYEAFRHRISTAVAGGTVSTRIMGEGA